MGMRQWAVKGLVGLGLLACSSGLALAQSSQPETGPTPEQELPNPADEVTPSLVENLQTYTLPESFSLDIPEGWIAEGTEAERSAVITNYSPDRPEGDIAQTTDIKTEVTLVNEPPDSFVDREITALIDQEYPVRRYTSVEVDERTALRLWVSDLPSEYAHQIITFVGYASYGTAMIVTSYNTYSIETDILIEQIHDSFELVF